MGISEVILKKTVVLTGVLQLTVENFSRPSLLYYSTYIAYAVKDPKYILQSASVSDVFLKKTIVLTGVLQ